MTRTSDARPHSYLQQTQPTLRSYQQKVELMVAAAEVCCGGAHMLQPRHGLLPLPFSPPCLAHLQAHFAGHLHHLIVSSLNVFHCVLYIILA